MKEFIFYVSETNKVLIKTLLHYIYKLFRENDNEIPKLFHFESLTI